MCACQPPPDWVPRAQAFAAIEAAMRRRHVALCAEALGAMETATAR